jgi:hypothetical protein
MSLRHKLSRLPSAAHSWLLSRPWLPLFRRFLGNRHRRYDVFRLADARDFSAVFDPSWLGIHVFIVPSGSIPVSVSP